MTRSEVITELKHEGYAATVGRVRQALLNGHVEPLPSKAARGAYDYQPEHLTQLRLYMVSVRPGPQPRSAMSLAIEGANDRVHRLEQAKRERAVSADDRRRLEAFDEVIRQLERLI